MKYSVDPTCVNFLKNFTYSVDQFTSKSGKHSFRVANWANRLAPKLDISDNQRQKLYWGALFHDIGKIAIPRQIWEKTTPLTQAEWDLIEMHPAIGASIVECSQGLPEVAQIVHSHQETYDGRGYPQGLGGEDIPVEARILSVVDAYDAMTDDRPYRAARSHSEAMHEIETLRGGQFDPQVVDAFVDMWQVV